MKHFIKKITPRWILSAYHFCTARVSAIVYGSPSKKMLIIGITGTKGKTSTAHYVWSVLQHSGIKTGMITTVAVRIGDEERVNAMHMSMPGRFFLQKTMKEMLLAGCEVVIIETTSQGIAQHRHKSIAYDIAIFTNLSPEHIDSHGSYENYRSAKAKLFESISHAHSKEWRGKKITPASILNADDVEYSFYNSIFAPQKYTYGLQDGAQIHATHVLTTSHTVSFSVDTTRYDLSVAGTFMIPNALAAIAVAKHLHLDMAGVSEAIHNVKHIAGRMQEIKTTTGFRVFVDYAHEKLSMKALLTNLKAMAEGKRVIVVFGAEGGGRDKSKRKDMSEMVSLYADYAVVSDVDPYDEDPVFIVEDIGQYLGSFGMVKDKNYFLISDRRRGIYKALTLAQPGDIVVCTALGAQESMARENGTFLPWNDVRVVEEELTHLEKNNV